ncbi:MAG: phage tail protein [Hellea sp.]
MPSHTEFRNSLHQIAPYKNFRFKLKWDENYVAGVSKAIGLTRTTEAITHRSSGDPKTTRAIAGQENYAPIKLERGVTYDLAFEQWANRVCDYQNSSAEGQQDGAGTKNVTLKDFRKDILLEVYNEAGQLVLAYNLHRCWPSEFTALPESGNAVAIQSLTLENEGWERDTSVGELSEPSFTLPAS